MCNRARLSGKESDQTLNKQYRNTLNRLKLHEKRKHYSSLFKKIGRNTKLLWNVINGILHKSNNKTEIVELIVNDKCVREESEISNIFNNHFAKAGQKVQSSILPAGENSVSDPCYYVKECKKSMRFSRITEGQICRIVSKMQSKMSYGVDGLSNFL